MPDQRCVDGVSHAGERLEQITKLNLAVIPHQTLLDSGIDQALETEANLSERPRTRMIANESQHNRIIPLYEMG